MTALARPAFSRRALLGASALSSLSFLFTAHASYAEAPRVEPLPGAPVLLCVFLRGAADGLNLIDGLWLAPAIRRAWRLPEIVKVAPYHTGGTPGHRYVPARKVRRSRR